MTSLSSPLAVVAHDAGATNLILGWVKNQSNVTVRTCLQGPAMALWSATFPNWKNESLSDALDDAAMLLSGTGWASDLEHEARRMARALGIFSIGVIDHWVNYRERFIRNGEEVLPDELFVADEDAQTEAVRCFPNLPVMLLPNRYLEGLVAQINALSPEPNERPGSHILYVLEPIRQPWGNNEEPGEFQALDFFLERVGALGLGHTPEVRLRSHPSDPPGKYASWLSRSGELNLTIDTSSSLAEAIAWADWVVGCQSFAMVVALHANRRVISTNPPWAPRCALPQRGIQHLRDL
ncbi:MAG: hypothetical protein Q8N00_07455 [Nitrospirota bacterium]|nr:hypothetical protein [Nitrospirota bacterium]